MLCSRLQNTLVCVWLGWGGLGHELDELLTYSRANCSEGPRHQIEFVPWEVLKTGLYQAMRNLV